MKPREKILAGVVVGIIALLLLFAGLRSAVTKPVDALKKQTAALREKLRKAEQERREYFDAEDALKSITQRTFALDLNQASARSGEMITKQLALAGLSESDFTRLPVGPRRLRGASEMGWSVQGKGDLRRVLNLLFLLENSPQAHRVEGVTLSAHDKPGEIKVRFLYLTLVVEPAPDVAMVELKPKADLESPARLAYDTILERDILRPYVKAPVPPPAPSTAPGVPAPGGPESMRVVSLSEWDGHPEVHIRDLSRNSTRRFKPGDKLEDHSEIVAVDYRALPLPRNPILTSHSRVILKVGGEFFAVERGQTLAEKRKLDETLWPLK